ncbi:MAG: FecR domain-containing protein [Deltaproteobacteria bacterium]|jgi:hypothetical protein|nr:FecR domain-containing protein [Deltaproteobacteria bacterium]
MSSRSLPKRNPIQLTRFLALGLALALLSLWGLADTLHAQKKQGAKVLSVKGKAEIKSAGRTKTARRGDIMEPGDTISVPPNGNVKLGTPEGNAEVTLSGGTTLSYDGPTNVNSRPWSPGPAVPARAGEESDIGPQFSVTEGEAEVLVTPGQPLRVVTPLLVAAVKGTRFKIKVEPDGSSTLNTTEGLVLAVSRDGTVKTSGPGDTVRVTANDYTAFLRKNGVRPQGDGDWRTADTQAIEKVDIRIHGDKMGRQARSGGGRSSDNGSAVSTSR